MLFSGDLQVHCIRKVPAKQHKRKQKYRHGNRGNDYILQQDTGQVSGKISDAENRSVCLPLPGSRLAEKRGGFRRWLCRIARNLSVSHDRTRRFVQVSFDDSHGLTAASAATSLPRRSRFCEASPVCRHTLPTPRRSFLCDAGRRSLCIPCRPFRCRKSCRRSLCPAGTADSSRTGS